MGGLAELCEKIGGDLAEIQDDRLAVDIVAHPARIVPGGDRDVGVPELRRHVPQLNARGQQLRGVRVAEILEPSVAELRALENPPPLATTEVAGIHNLFAVPTPCQELPWADARTILPTISEG